MNKWLPAALAVLVFAVYLAGLSPGIEEGDSGELQFMSVTLGICHSPGYQIQTLFGWLFSSLPLGGNGAWRVNLMSAVAGVLGCLALYGAVARITGRPFAGLIAATTLAFSVVYWSFAVVAESYVFSGCFLAAAVYAAVRFVQEDSHRWFFALALILGATVADRPSELFVLPAFAGLLFFNRAKSRWDAKRVAIAGALAVLPFAFCVGSLIVRSDPGRLANRDDFLRDRIVGPESEEIRFGVDPHAPLARRLRQAASYALGLSWAADSFDKLRMPRITHTLEKYAWLIGGLGAFGDRYHPGKLNRAELRGGTNIGILGVILALIGTWSWRRKPGWLALGWGLFLGNLAFIVFHARWDNLTFTVPGALGLSLIAGLGAAWRRNVFFRAVCLLVPAMLLLTNGAYASRNTPPDRRAAERRMSLTRAPWPEGSVIIATYWPVMALRYFMYIEAGRPDIRVIQAARPSWPALVRHFGSEGDPIFIPRLYVRRGLPPSAIRRAPPPLAKLDFIQAVSEGLDE